MTKKSSGFIKMKEEDTDSVEGAVSFREIAACVIKKRDHIAKQAGLEPEDVVLGACKLVFVVGTPIRGKIIEGALIVQCATVKGGYEFLTPIVDADND
jgi:hypothetical protein